jgi:hypothetical protein
MKRGGTRDENWQRLERQRDEAWTLLRALDSVLIADIVLRAGFHPHRGHGRAITEILVARHRAQHRTPLIPKVDISAVLEVAAVLGHQPDLEPTDLAQTG